VLSSAGYRLPKARRSPSASSSVNAAPTVGPSITNMPPAIAPNTICRLMPMPDTVSGLT